MISVKRRDTCRRLLGLPLLLPHTVVRPATPLGPTADPLYPAIDLLRLAGSADAALTAWLQAAGLDGAPLSLQVQALDGGPVVLQRAVDAALNPASSIKLFTTYAGLLELGADYRWETRFMLDGELRDGHLDGNLVLIGGGDPKFVIEDLTDMLARMRAAGLQHIGGDLLIDRSLYAPTRVERAFDGLPAEPYNVQPDAALMNFKSVKFIISPGPRGRRIELDPPLAGIVIDDALILEKGRCRHGAGGLQISETPRSRGRPAIRVGGRYSVGCGQTESFHAVLDHASFADAFFRAGWMGAGGTWKGRARTLPGRSALADRDPWFIWRSPRRLAEVVSDIHKFSNNVMTRQLLLHLGALRGGLPADEAAGARVVMEHLKRRGIPDAGLVLDNGAGLSRTARCSAHSLIALLLDAAGGEQALMMRESLPVVGVDGTMKRRLREHPVAGRAWIKTGSIDDVRSIAGYLDARSGRRYALAMIVNSPKAAASVAVQDELLKWLFEHG